MTWIADLRAALRAAAGRPGFGLAVVLTLGIETSAAAAVFAIVDAVLIRPLPYPDSDRIAGVLFASPNFPGDLERCVSRISGRMAADPYRSSRRPCRRATHPGNILFLEATFQAGG